MGERTTALVRCCARCSLAGAVAWLAGCDLIERRKPVEVAPPPPEVLVLAAAAQDVPIVEEWIGSADGYVNAVIRPQVTGYLQQQNYKEGAFVKQGEVLFTIDPRPFQAALDQAKGQLGRAEAMLGKATIDVNRYTPLAAQSAISQQELDDAIQAKLGAEAEVASAKANVDAAQLNLGFTHVTSLIDGIAGIANAQVGNLIGPASPPLTTVSKVDPIKVYFPVSEQDYLKAAEKINAHLTPTSEVDPAGDNIALTLVLTNGSIYPMTGKFLLADRQVDTLTGTIKVAAEFPNPDSLLRPGQYARIRGTTSTRENAVVVPQRAVVDVQGSKQVVVVGADGKIVVRPVTVGPRYQSLWVIETGVEAGEIVVIEGQQKVRPGEKVTTKPWTPAAADDNTKQPAATTAKTAPATKSPSAGKAATKPATTPASASKAADGKVSKPSGNGAGR